MVGTVFGCSEYYVLSIGSETQIVCARSFGDSSACAVGRDFHDTFGACLCHNETAIGTDDGLVYADAGIYALYTLHSRKLGAHRHRS